MFFSVFWLEEYAITIDAVDSFVAIKTFCLSDMLFHALNKTPCGTTSRSWAAKSSSGSALGTELFWKFSFFFH